MSRERWFSTIQSRSSRTPLKDRTSDPMAADYDEACELFSQGMRLARSGDLEAGRGQIATAYLLDGRSINFASRLPAPEAANSCLDLELLYQLAQADATDPRDITVHGHVLRLFLAIYMCLASDKRQGQTFIAGAMNSVDFLLHLLEEEPHLGARGSKGGVLGGYMTKTNLLWQRSALQMAVGNHKNAIKDLTKALKIDPSFTRARDARASLWESCKLKDNKTLFNEYKIIVSEFHPDNRALEVTYAWLSLTVMADAQLGTMEDAKMYYSKCLRAKMRRDELYGIRMPGEEDPPCVKLATDQYKYLIENPQARKSRETLDLDTLVLSKESDDSRIPYSSAAFPKGGPHIDLKAQHACLACGKSANAVGRPLSKCSQCKSVSYCSKECQRNDWESHKVFCKLVKDKPKLEEVTRKEKKSEHGVGSTPID